MSYVLSCLTFVSLSAGNDTRPENPCRVLSLKMPFVTLLYVYKPLALCKLTKWKGREGSVGRQ